MATMKRAQSNVQYITFNKEQLIESLHEKKDFFTVETFLAFILCHQTRQKLNREDGTTHFEFQSHIDETILNTLNNDYQY